MDKPKYTRDLNTIVTDPNPQKSYIMMGQKGRDPLTLYVGDQTPEGDVLEEIGDRSATFLPPYQEGLETQRPAYTRTMGDNPRPTKTSPPKPGSSRQEMADWSQKFFSNQRTADLMQEPNIISKGLLPTGPFYLEKQMAEAEYDKQDYFDNQIKVALENGDQDWADFLAREKEESLLKLNDIINNAATSQDDDDFIDTSGL